MYYFVYFLLLFAFSFFTFTQKVNDRSVFYASFLSLIFWSLSSILDEKFFDLKIYFDISYSFYYVDDVVVYILLFLQFISFIAFSKNLGYNAVKK